jgi:hypothetical protein
MNARWSAVERLYHAALERPADERATFLIEACAGDEILHREVESLLAYTASSSAKWEMPRFHAGGVPPAVLGNRRRSRLVRENDRCTRSVCRRVRGHPARQGAAPERAPASTCVNDEAASVSSVACLHRLYLMHAYTIRGVPAAVDSALRDRARAAGKSLNQAAIEALQEGAGVTGSRRRRRDLGDIAGT